MALWATHGLRVQYGTCAAMTAGVSTAVPPKAGQQQLPTRFERSKRVEQGSVAQQQSLYERTPA